MPVIYQTTNITQTNANASALTLGAGDQLILMPNVAIAHTNGGAAIASSQSGAVKLDGSAVGSVAVETDAAAGSALNVVIGATGRATGYGIAAIRTDTSQGSLSVVNHGEIAAIAQGGDGIKIQATNTFSIWNYGTITGLNDGVDSAGFIGSLVNGGTITGQGGYGFQGGAGAETVINFGTIGGNMVAVSLGDQSDLYDGRGGRAIGIIDGGNGNNTLYGGLGADSLFGGSGNDFLYADAEDLALGTVSGGDSGFDWLVYTDDETPLLYFMATGSFEGFQGSAADEFIVLNYVSPSFTPFVKLNGGNDTAEGTNVYDAIYGGGGDDLINGGGGVDNLVGEAGDDYLIGGAGGDFIVGDYGDDTILGGDDSDPQLFGNAGKDVIMGEAGDDSIFGGDGDDTWLAGGDGADVINGEAGHDLIHGDAGNDVWLAGGEGDDTIIGGGGADYLIGGFGLDQFQFHAVTNGGDTIADFVSGQDKLFFAAAAFGSNVAFVFGIAPAPASTAPTLLYNTATGVLTYDANGVTAGGQTVMATFVGAPTLAVSDLLFG